MSVFHSGADFRYVLGLFIALLLILPIILSDVEKIVWKRFDYASLLLAAFGLFPATFNSQQWVKTDYMNQTKHVVDLNAGYVMQVFANAENYYCGSVPNQAASSKKPDPAKESTCNWLNDQRANLVQNAQQRLPVALDELGVQPSVAPRVLSDLTACAKQYNGLVAELTELQKPPDHVTFLEGMNNLVQAFSLLWGPYALAVALAFQLTKVSIEIREERNKATPAKKT